MGCFLLAFLYFTVTVMWVGSEVVKPLGAPVPSKPVPETIVLSFLPDATDVFENPVIVGPVTVTFSLTVSVVPLVLEMTTATG